MPTPHPLAPHALTHEESAFFARLAALNTVFEAARAGQAAKSFAHRALSSDALLAAYLDEIKAKNFTQ